MVLRYPLSDRMGRDFQSHGYVEHVFVYTLKPYWIILPTMRICFVLSGYDYSIQTDRTYLSRSSTTAPVEDYFHVGNMAILSISAAEVSARGNSEY